MSIKMAWQKDPVVKGLGLRQFPSGNSSYAVKKREGEKVRTITLGGTDTLTIEEARKKALEVLQQQPKEKKVSGAPTLREVMGDYLKSHSLKPRSAAALKGSIETHFTDWLDKPMSVHTREDVQKRIQRIAVDAAKRKTKVRTANQRGLGAQAKASRYIKAMFRYAVTEEKLDKDPTLVIKAKKLVKKLKRRKTYILPSLRQKFMKAIEGTEVEDFIKVLLATALRFSEAINLRWEDISLEDQLLSIPDTKNGEPFTLPYPATVVEILNRLHRIQLDKLEDKTQKVTGPVFRWKDGSPMRTPYKHFKAIINASGITFSPHDLRRTWASTADYLGVPKEQIKLCMNHKVEDVTDGYIIRSPEKLRPVFQLVDNNIWRDYAKGPESNTGGSEASSASRSGSRDDADRSVQEAQGI